MTACSGTHYNIHITVVVVAAVFAFVVVAVVLVFVIVKTPTPTQHNTTVGFDTKMTMQTPPPPHRNFSATSRPARELKFGTDIH